MKRELTCIICPRGCTLTAQREEGRVTVTGQDCNRGERYAVDECTAPVRTVTSSVRVENREDTMLSVKTDAPIPKEHLFAAMERIRACRVQAPISIGDVILPDLFGAAVVATRGIK